MKNKYIIQKVSPAYTDDDWKKYFLLKKKYAKLKGTPHSHNTWQKMKIHTLTRINNGVGVYQVWKNDAPIGDFSLQISYKKKLEKRFVTFYNRLLDTSLNEDLLRLVFETFLDYDPLSNSLVITSKNGENDFIEEQFQIEAGGNRLTFELNMKEANVEKIDQWLEVAKQKFSHLTLRFYKDIPDDLLEEYAAVFTQLLHEMPANSGLMDFNITAAGIQERQKLSRKFNEYSYRYLVFNEENKLIAKTNLAIKGRNPKRIHQYMTGVLSDYRQLGIGKWIKAAMFKKLEQDFPNLEFIETETHPKNIGSKSISEQMGFQQTGFEKDFLIPKSDVLAFLSVA